MGKGRRDYSALAVLHYITMDGKNIDDAMVDFNAEGRFTVQADAKGLPRRTLLASALREYLRKEAQIETKVVEHIGGFAADRTSVGEIEIRLEVDKKQLQQPDLGKKLRKALERLTEIAPKLEAEFASTTNIR